jgi:hypothetical protein
MRKIIILVILGVVLPSQVVFAQCANVPSVLQAACQTGRAVAGGNTQGSSHEGLNTSFADVIHGQTLDASVNPDNPSPLVELKRANDGSFILQPGIYEAYVQGFSLDPTDGTPVARMDGYLPAPLKGSRAAIVAAILKAGESHPEVTQLQMQMLLFAVVANDGMEKWPQDIKQTAVRLIPKEMVGQLQGSTVNAELKNKALNAVNKQINNNRTLSADMWKFEAKKQALDDKSGGLLSSGLSIIGSMHSGKKTAIPDLVARGTWMQMPDGFYLRYLTDLKGVHVQVAVPEEVVKGGKTVTFDPTQYVAVYGGTPAQRLGISLRAVQ